jgi:hypothetical protein
MFGNAAVGKDQKSNLIEMGTKTSFTNKNEQTVEEKNEKILTSSKNRKLIFS